MFVHTCYSYNLMSTTFYLELFPISINPPIKTFIYNLENILIKSMSTAQATLDKDAK
jgi:hypothetical protein